MRRVICQQNDQESITRSWDDKRGPLIKAREEAYCLILR